MSKADPSLAAGFRQVLPWTVGGMLLIGLVIAGIGMTQGPQAPVSTPDSVVASTTGKFEPPSEDAIPEGPDGDSIRRGMEIFLNTGTAAARYAGSSLSCGNCHLDAGRTANASPMWAAWVKYPAYRTKDNAINTMEDRIRGCFVYSMNAGASPAGVPPPYGDDIYRDLQAYFAWLATGAPMGMEMAGRGYPKLPEPAQGFDLASGEQVYAENCVACHGANGEGVQNPDGTYAYPPLWGPHSFNWGAGMGKLPNASGFIKANMPFGNGNSLTDQQAWDVAAYVMSHERPPDPRQKGTTIEATREAHHKSGDYYGQVINGDLLGDGVS